MSDLLFGKAKQRHIPVHANLLATHAYSMHINIVGTGGSFAIKCMHA